MSLRKAAKRNQKSQHVSSAENDLNKSVMVIKIADTESGGRRSVKDEDYFHGFISEKHTVSALLAEGDFLVRQTVKEVKNNMGSREYFTVSIKQTDAVYRRKDLDEAALQKDEIFFGKEKTLSGYQKRFGEATDLGKKQLISGQEYQQLDKELQKLYEMMDSGIGHFPLKYSKRARLFYMNKYGFARSSGLIDFHRCQKISVSETDPTAILKRPINRAKWQYNHEQIEKIKTLGNGAFGEVFEAIVHLGLIQSKRVAVKAIKGTVTAEENEKLLEEAALMQPLIHPNVALLIGVATNEEPLMLLMELAPGGSLFEALQGTKGHYLTISKKINYIFGAAYGIEYLHSKEIIHRDIAARNVLIGEGDVAKITDFGLSLRTAFKQEERLNKVPTNYLAPETLASARYSPASDMYSFGVLMYEVFHDGPAMEQIYGGMPKEQVSAFVKAGKRLGIQPWAQYPCFFWQLTKSCWQSNPQNRISSGELVKAIEKEDRLQHPSFFHSPQHGSWRGIELQEPVADGWRVELDEDALNEDN